MGLLEDILQQLVEVRTELAALRTINNAVAVEREPFIDVKEAAQLLKLSVWTVRDKCQRRVLPHYQESAGAPHYFRRNELLDWLASKRKPTADATAAGKMKTVHPRRTGN